jgi:hypothetical protein
MRCVNCGWLKSAHIGTGLVCPGATYAAYATLELPEGKTCGDCRYAGFCDQFIGVDRNVNQCDWYPIRFVEKAA